MDESICFQEKSKKVQINSYFLEYFQDITVRQRKWKQEFTHILCLPTKGGT